MEEQGWSYCTGCTGISLTLVDKKKEGLIPFIEKRAGFKFERVGAPQPADMAKLAGAQTHRVSTMRISTFRRFMMPRSMH